MRADNWLILVQHGATASSVRLTCILHVYLVYGTLATCRLLTYLVSVICCIQFQNHINIPIIMETGLISKCVTPIIYFPMPLGAETQSTYVARVPYSCCTASYRVAPPSALSIYLSPGLGERISRSFVKTTVVTWMELLDHKM